MEDGEKEDVENKITDVRNKVLIRNSSADNEEKTYSKQSSIKSQISHDSVRGDMKVTITPATPVKSPLTPKEFPIVTFNDHSDDNGASDSFESDDGEEEESNVEDEVFVVSRDDDNKESNPNRLTRPVSITSQIST